MRNHHHRNLLWSLIGLATTVGLVTGVFFGQPQEASAARKKTTGNSRTTTTRSSTTSTTSTTAPPSSTTSTTAPVTTTTVAPSIAPSTSNNIYWGAWIHEVVNGTTIQSPWDPTATSTFEQHAGKGVSLINWSSPFYASFCGGNYYCNFSASVFSAVRDHGSIPFFSWANGPATGAFTDAQIAAGSQDAYITAWAQAAKAWGYPFFLRFAWEMNGSWMGWGVGANGNTAADYVAMWRHVHDVFTGVGATNASWVWCPNIDPANHLTNLASLYPGDAYVDWTCLDGYNGNTPWNSFSNLFSSTYQTITGSIAPSKPMVIGETASTESGGSKPQWITDMANALPTNFPQVRGLLWFNVSETGPGGYTDWPIESTAATQSAFATAIGSSRFTSNQYSSITASPIPPP